MKISSLWQSHAVKLILAYLIILLAVVAVGYLLFHYSSNTRDSFEYTHAGSISCDTVNNQILIFDRYYNIRHVVDDSIAGASVFPHMLAQLQLIRTRAVRHYQAFTYFVQVQFILNIVKALLIGITTALGLFTLRSGWEKTNRFILHLGFIFTGSIAFVQLGASVFNLETNVHNNEQKLIVYRNLETDIFLFLATGTTNHNKHPDARAYSRFIDREIIKHYNLEYISDKLEKNNL